MKKFKFSLQSVLRVKTIHEKQKKAELAEIQSVLNKLLTHRADLVKKLENSSSQYGAEMRAGMTVPRMAWYLNFADYIQSQIKALDVSIREAEQKKQDKRTELIAVVKEIKTIEKLREEQYKAYLEEVSKEEEKVLGDLISFNKTMETAG